MRSDIDGFWGRHAQDIVFGTQPFFADLNSPSTPPQGAKKEDWLGCRHSARVWTSRVGLPAMNMIHSQPFTAANPARTSSVGGGNLRLFRRLNLKHGRWRWQGELQNFWRMKGGYEAQTCTVTCFIGINQYQSMHSGVLYGLRKPEQTSVFDSVDVLLLRGIPLWDNPFCPTHVSGSFLVIKHGFLKSK